MRGGRGVATPVPSAIAVTVVSARAGVITTTPAALR